MCPAVRVGASTLGNTRLRRCFWVGFRRPPATERGALLLRVPFSIFRPESKPDYPPNLSILISGGKENNCDSLSNGE